MSDWGPLPAEELELPTGRVCRVRRPSTSVLAATGQIPNPVLASVMRALRETSGGGETRALARVAEQDASAYFAYQIHLVKAALVEPLVYLPGETPPKGGVPIGNLTEAEIQTIAAWLQQEEKPARLGKFRRQRGGDGAGGDGGEVRAPAE